MRAFVQLLRNIRHQGFFVHDKPRMRRDDHRAHNRPRAPFPGHHRSQTGRRWLKAVKRSPDEGPGMRWRFRSRRRRRKGAAWANFPFSAESPHTPRLAKLFSTLRAGRNCPVADCLPHFHKGVLRALFDAELLRDNRGDNPEIFSRVLLQHSRNHFIAVTFEAGVQGIDESLAQPMP